MLSLWLGLLFLEENLTKFITDVAIFHIHLTYPKDFHFKHKTQIVSSFHLTVPQISRGYQRIQ